MLFTEDDMRAAAAGIHHALFQAGFTRDALRGVQALIDNDDAGSLLYLLHSNVERLAYHLINSGLPMPSPLVSGDLKTDIVALRAAGLKQSDRRRVLRTITPQMAGVTPVADLAYCYVSRRLMPRDELEKPDMVTVTKPDTGDGDKNGRSRK